MRKIKYTLGVCILLSLQSIGQITITNFEKKNTVEVLRPPQYDSLKKFERFDYHNSDPTYPKTEEQYYKQYVGIKIYFPPCEGSYVTNFYSIKPTVIKLDKEANISNKPYNNIVTFTYKPVFIDESADRTYGGAKRTYGANQSNCFWLCTNYSDIGNRYYTILDILNWKTQQKGNIDNYFEDRGIFHILLQDGIITPDNSAFVIKDDISGDTIYVAGNMSEADYGYRSLSHKISRSLPFLPKNNVFVNLYIH